MQVKDFITIEKKDGIATLWLDHQFEKMNVASPAVIEIMAKVSPMIEEDASIKAAIIISRKPDFMAGADIKAFSIEKKGDFRPFQEGGHQSLLRLENSQKPIVAAIHGACLGLGMELALACHARIATSSSRTVFALPEVKLGILPGGGGTQRLPRLVGIQKALDMMLTGKNIYASRAKKMGLVDELTHENKLHYAATILAKKLIKKPLERKSKLTLVEKLLESNPVGRSIVFSQARKIAMKQSQGNYPAIPAILDCVETGYKEGIGAGYEKELEHFEDLILTPESAALRSVFFAITENKKNPYPSSDFKIETLGMIGAGFMGAGIAEVTVTKGIEVLLKDIKEPVLASAYRQIWKSLEKKVKRKSITKTQAEEQIGNLTGQLTYDNFEHADIVIEAVLEVMKLKKIIIGDIEKHGKEDVIIATNTSSLSVTEMAKHAKRPEMVIGMHYFSPVPKMPLLEIVKTDLTSEAVISACYDLGLKQGKTVVVVKDGPGFYVNRILAPYLNECLLMIEEGLAIDAIDKALLKKGFPVGPITLLDQVGLDIAAHVTESTRVISEGREGMIISEGVTEMAAAGYYGKKNKLGFYHYDEKTGKRKGVNSDAYPFFKGDGTKTLPVEDIQNRALMLMLNEAVLCLEEGIIAQPADGDLGAVFGIGFLPFTGGPFRYMDTLGIKKVLAIMDYLKGKYGVKFTPAETLVRMGKSESRFYE